MFPLLAAAAPALLSGAASVFGQSSANKANRRIAEETNFANAQQAQANRDWQERMSNTAHQREVQDLREAGLNPILSASGGSGASSPPGAVSTAQTGAPMQSTTARATEALMSSLAAKKNAAEINLLHSQAANTNANTARTIAGQDKANTESEMWRLMNKLGHSAAGTATAAGHYLGQKAGDLADQFRYRFKSINPITNK